MEKEITTETIEGWSEWTAQLLAEIDKGYMEAAANMLACCCERHSYHKPDDLAGYDSEVKIPTREIRLLHPFSFNAIIGGDFPDAFFAEGWYGLSSTSIDEVDK